MSFAISSARLAGLALGMALALLVDPCAHGFITRGTFVEINQGTDPSKPLTPEVKTKIKEFFDKAKVEKEKVWNTRMEKEIADVTKTTGLDDAHAKMLTDPAKQAAHAGVDAWATKMDDQTQNQLAMMPPAQATLMLNQLMAMTNIAAYANTDWAGNITEPYDQDVWIKALHQVLTPDQMAAWDKALADRKSALEKEVAGAMKNSLDRVRMQETQAMKSRTDAIETALSLPKDRSDKLEAAAGTAIDQGTEMYRQRTEKIFLSMGEAQRKQFSGAGNIFFNPDPSEAPDQQPAWKDALPTLLTADETARLKSAQDDRRAGRVHVMGQVMITLLDDQVALTEAQRQKLGPLADRLIKDVSQLFPENGDTSPYFNYQPSLFYAAADKATEADLKPILDAPQLKHWREISQPDNPPDAAARDDKAEPSTEPGAVERALSEYLYHKTEAERKRDNAENMLKAEDAIRVAGLGTETAARLEIAARGMTEEYLTNWKWMVEQQVRAQLQGVTPQNIKERLASMQDFFFGRNLGIYGQQSVSVWDETVKTALTAQQQEAWQKETDARTAFQDQAIAGLVMAEFDRKVSLSASQKEKLTPIIAGVVHDSSPEISQMFSNPNNPPWFLNSQFLLIPFAGVDDHQLKSILTKDQMDIWRSDPNCANGDTWWQNVKQLHVQRMQQEERMKKQNSP
jgi:hypothetical protein